MAEERMVEEQTARAVAKYVRVAPRKVRLVTDLIRGHSAEEAVNILRFTTKQASKAVLKVLSSAIANAKQNAKVKEENLHVSQAYVDEGPTLKRFRPRAMGRASRIKKRTSHITIVVAERLAEEGTKETKTTLDRRGFPAPRKKRRGADARPPSRGAKPRPKKEEKSGTEG
jgi:large subunit ribosomal protein L22